MRFIKAVSDAASGVTPFAGWLFGPPATFAPREGAEKDGRVVIASNGAPCMGDCCVNREDDDDL